MADVFRNSADVLKINNSEEAIGLIDSVLPSYPLLNALFSSAIKGYTYKTLLRTTLPSVDFRAENTGAENTKGAYSNEEVIAYYMDASWVLDKLISSRCEWGIDSCLAMEAKSHLEAAFQAIESQIFYGTGASANGFNGIGQTLADTDEEMVVSAGGALSNVQTSVYAIKTGMRDCQLIWGQAGSLTMGQIEEQFINEGTGRFRAHTQEIAGYAGLQMGSAYSVGRLANIDSTSLLDDDDISNLLSVFKAGKMPDFLVMNRSARKYLQQSRSATSPTGAPAPFPENAFGVPIIITDNITDTEAVLAAAGS